MLLAANAKRCHRLADSLRQPAHRALATTTAAAGASQQHGSDPIMSSAKAGVSPSTSSSTKAVARAGKATTSTSHHQVESSHHHRLSFAPKRVLLLSKLTRYEFEKRRHRQKSELELKDYLSGRGSDVGRLVHLHDYHKQQARHVHDILKKHGIEARMVDRFAYGQDAIDWADAIVTAGGDGTFLVGASEVRTREKPVIGVNTDPSRSEGFLLLPRAESLDFAKGLKKLRDGQFRWRYRSRISIKLSGKEPPAPPIELHDQQLDFPQHHESEWAQEWRHRRDSTSSESRNFSDLSGLAERLHDSPDKGVILPEKALNEVFIGESLASRVSYLEIQIDDHPPVKQKSSGIVIGTGTGSTSWVYNINKLSRQDAASVMRFLKESGHMDANADGELLKKCVDSCNSHLVMSPSSPHLMYTIRDPVFDTLAHGSSPRGFAKKIVIRSRCYDACLVIDGSRCYKFNDGALATFTVKHEDDLKTIELT